MNSIEKNILYTDLKSSFEWLQAKYPLTYSLNLGIEGLIDLALAAKNDTPLHETSIFNVKGIFHRANGTLDFLISLCSSGYSTQLRVMINSMESAIKQLSEHYKEYLA